MTDEEIKNKAKETSGGNYYYEQGFIYGFELGEENGRKELEKEKCELLGIIQGKDEVIEKMKCCGNCKHCVFKYDDEDLIFECDITGIESYTHLKTCKNWELGK